MVLVFSKTFRTFTDLFKDEFDFLQLFYRDVLEGTFDECRMSAKERDEHSASFFSQGDCPDPTILGALCPADKTLVV
jgi:hypothetical protein